MAPRKRKGSSETERRDTTTFKRVTRSQSRGDVKEKVVVVRKKKSVPKKESKSEEDAGKPRVEKVAEVDADADVDKKDNGGGVHQGKTIVVEHCTQCTQFKKRAIMVQEGLIDAVPGVTVVLNPVKPRRGCFEIREDLEGGETFVSLLDMKRPFKPMKDLVMEDVIASIIEKIKE